MHNLAAVMQRPGVIVVQERPTRDPRGREVAVRIEAVGVCGSDTTYLTAGRIGDYVVDGAIVLGHEAAGQVAAVGPDVTRVRVGDRVAIEPGTPCRDCRECLTGNYHLCPRLVFLATPPHDGALVQRLVIDERNLFAIPDGMSYEDGAMVEPLSVGLWACRRATLRPGDDVLVTGAGPVGILAAQAARALGAARVVLTDVSPFRVGFARSLGFEAHDGEADADARFDVLIECSGASGVLPEALERLRPAGRAAIVGMAKGDVALALAHYNPRELTISMVNRYAHTWPTAISLISSGRVDVRSIVTHRFPLAETERALLLARRDPHSLKAIVQPQL